MPTVAQIFLEDLRRSNFFKAVIDDDNEFIDMLNTRDDDYSSESEEL